MTDPANPDRATHAESGFHEFSRSGSNTDDQQETGSLTVPPVEPIGGAAPAALPEAFGRYQVLALAGPPIVLILAL